MLFTSHNQELLTMPHPLPIGKLFDEAIDVLHAQGFAVRYEHLGGNGTGFCQVGQQRLVVVDVAQNAEEQLDQLAGAIASQPWPDSIELSNQLCSLVLQSCSNPSTVD